jgi:hypothetical protein
MPPEILSSDNRFSTRSLRQSGSSSLKDEQVRLSPYNEARTGAGFPLTLRGLDKAGEMIRLLPSMPRSALSQRVINV